MKIKTEETECTAISRKRLRCKLVVDDQVKCRGVTITSLECETNEQTAKAKRTTSTTPYGAISTKGRNLKFGYMNSNQIRMQKQETIKKKNEANDRYIQD